MIHYEDRIDRYCITTILRLRKNIFRVIFNINMGIASYSTHFTKYYDMARWIVDINYPNNINTDTVLNIILVIKYNT